MVHLDYLNFEYVCVKLGRELVGPFWDLEWR
jgi:hypothetical protein